MPRQQMAHGLAPRRQLALHGALVGLVLAPAGRKVRR
jgi:hypothetical protein